MTDETPETARQRVRRCGSDLARAELSLKNLRDREVEAEQNYRAAQRRAMLGPDCPKVVRGGTTTAERDAWVDAQVQDEEFAYRIASAACEAAKDHYKTVNAQSMLAMAILRSIDTAFNVAGRSEP